MNDPTWIVEEKCVNYLYVRFIRDAAKHHSNRRDCFKGRSKKQKNKNIISLKMLQIRAGFTDSKITIITLNIMSLDRVLMLLLV